MNTRLTYGARGMIYNFIFLAVEKQEPEQSEHF